MTVQTSVSSSRRSLPECARFSAEALPLSRPAENAVRTMLFSSDASPGLRAAPQALPTPDLSLASSLSALSRVEIPTAAPAAKPARLPRELRRDTRLRAAAIDGTALAPAAIEGLKLAEALPPLTDEAVERVLALRRGIGAEIGRPLSSALAASARPSKCSARNLSLMKPFEAAMRRRAPAGSALIADCADGRLPDELPAEVRALSFDAFAFGFAALAQLRLETALPILARGAFLTESAVLAAAEAGADAVAVPLHLLSDSGAERVIRAAASLGVEVVAEGMDEEQLLAALRLGVEMAGIASIDPMTLEADPGRAAALADFVPRRCVLLCRGAAETAAMMAKTARRAGRALVFIAGEAVFGGARGLAQAA